MPAIVSARDSSPSIAAALTASSNDYSLRNGWGIFPEAVIATCTCAFLNLDKNIHCRERVCVSGFSNWTDTKLIIPSLPREPRGSLWCLSIVCHSFFVCFQKSREGTDLSLGVGSLFAPEGV